MKFVGVSSVLPSGQWSWCSGIRWRNEGLLDG